MRKKILFLPIQAIILSLIFLTSCSSESEEIESVITKTWKLEQITDQETGETIEALEDEYLSILNTDENIFNLSFPALELGFSGSWTMENDSLMLLPELEDIALEIDSIMYEASKGDPYILFFNQGELIAQVSGDMLKGKERPMFFMVDELSEDDLILSDDKYTYYLKYKPTEITTFAFGITNIIRGLFGMIVLIAIAWVFSANRKAISWKVVGIGLTIQVFLAIGVLQVPAIQYFFEFIGQRFVEILDFTKAGTEFLFGGFLDTETYGFIFAFQVLPTIIFFSALTSLLFYLGIIQKIVYGLAWLMTKAMKL